MTPSEGTRIPFPVAASLLMCLLGSGRAGRKVESTGVK